MIKNITKKQIIEKEYYLCKNIVSKTIGLMFSRKKNLIFVFDREKRISLHMIFVFFPIWVIYLNKDNIAVFIKKLYPFISYCYPKAKALYIIELVEDPKVSVGDLIKWE